jgi:hypothetical protein
MILYSKFWIFQSSANIFMNLRVHIRVNPENCSSFLIILFSSHYDVFQVELRININQNIILYCQIKFTLHFAIPIENNLPRLKTSS